MPSGLQRHATSIPGGQGLVYLASAIPPERARPLRCRSSARRIAAIHGEGMPIT